MRLWRLWTLVILVAALASPALAGKKHQQSAPKTVYVFGHSYSDNGNGVAMFPDVFNLEAPYAVPRFSNGPIWVDYLAKRLGTTIDPEVDGGTNYAVSGSTTSPENYYTWDPAATGFAQVDRYLATHGAADPSAIYVVWLGTDIDPPAEFTEWCFDQLVVMIGRLYDAGARNFLVPNVVDFGTLPVIVDVFGDPVYAQQLGEMTVLFNELLEDLPSRFPLAKFRISDVFKLEKMVRKYPRRFGFKVADEPCYRDMTDRSLCSNPDDYWYWDYQHPTTHAHKVLSSLFLADLLLAGEVKITDLRQIPEP